MSIREIFGDWFLATIWEVLSGPLGPKTRGGAG